MLRHQFDPKLDNSDLMSGEPICVEFCSIMFLNVLFLAHHCASF